MSGWGCRYQIDEQCLLLRKECKPGMPGCVLYKKVVFAKDVAVPRKTAVKAKAKAKRKATKAKA